MCTNLIHTSLNATWSTISKFIMLTFKIDLRSEDLSKQLKKI